MWDKICSSPGRNRDKNFSINIRDPYKAIHTKNIKQMEKFKDKIDQEARKTLVLSHVANPKVSEI